ncbi:clustered mitochondria protein homolog isoform X1 [Hydra vulgaris]|uniref:clustered mitochondria protein homolog isoform X1 n=1 Tax=Hydra vulgaris TaxID=6087 RepID=UPI0001925625|nr:clustered mitochondria protein homolog [Hydra vulgaris]
MPAALCQDHPLNVPELHSSKILNGDHINKEITNDNFEDEKIEEKFKSEPQKQVEVVNENPSLNDCESKEVPVKILDIKIQISGVADIVTIQLSNHDTVQDIRQVVLEKPECCHRTCFSLYLDNTRLDDFMELHDITALNNDSVIKVVDEPYSVRESRIHIRRLRDLLFTMIEPNAFNAIDNLSLSYCSAITEIDIEEEALKNFKEPNSVNSVKVTSDILPPQWATLENGESPLLEPLVIKSNDVQLPACLTDLRYSSWNPPPGYRKLAGDLLYLEVTLLEDVDCIHYITSSSTGFFVNKSTKLKFDPKPSNDTPRSQTLAGLLMLMSPLFKKNFSIVQKTSSKKNPLELVASPHQVFSWVSPQFEHHQDPFRAEDSVTNRIGYEEQIPGQLRDWNEELQSAKELPKKTLHQRILRDRALYKITSDFVSAASRGAVAVVDGNVMAINPGEEVKMRMYIWNNIFFSFACDSRDHYKKYGGDPAAYAAASLDLKGIEMYNKLDLDGLYTLGTVVIDYRGYRIIAQSIIPGILQREQENSVVYGSVDGGKTISTEPKFLEKLKIAGLSLRIRPHKVINEKGEDVELCSSFECKGIIGADGRYYILDLFRTFPPDINFLEVENVKRNLIDGEAYPDKTNKDKNQFSYPKGHTHQLVSMRPPIVEAFIGSKYVSFVKVIAVHKLYDEKVKHEKEDSKKEKLTEKNEDSKSITNTKVNGTVENETLESNEVDKVSTCNGTDITKEENDQVDKLKEEEDKSDLIAIEAAAKAIGSLNPREFDIRFNPDAYVQEVKLSGSEEEIDKLDKLLIEDIALFMSSTVISKMVEDFTTLNSSPIDGIALTDILHSRGINIRYLGKIAHMVTEKEAAAHILKIVVKEMIIRSARKHFKEFIQSANQKCLSAAVSHFLNCFLSSFPNPQPQVPAEENQKKKKNKKRQQKSHLSNKKMIWMSLSPEILWTFITNYMEKHFGYKLECASIDDFISKFHLQKVSFLREFCKKTGIQVLLREYDFSSKKNPTFHTDDIINMFPVVKYTTPKATDACAIFETAQNRLQAGFFGEAHELMVEALNMFNQVYGPLHEDIVVCYRAIARIHYLADDAPQAVSFQKKAVIVAERIFGIDHPETLVAYVHLALYCYHAGLANASLKLMYRSRYLTLLAFGDDHPDMAAFDTNIGLMLHNQREFSVGCKFLERSCYLQMKYHGPKSIHTATSHHLVARALTALGEYKSALNSEKMTFSIYQSHFGDGDPRTKESSEALKTILNQAVMLQKTLKDITEKGLISSTRLPHLDDEKEDKIVLAMVNKIKDLSATDQPVKILNSSKT